MPKKAKREREVEREMEYEEVGGDAFDDAEEAPPASSSAADAVTVTGAMVAAWRKELLRSEKAATLKKVVGAFRAAVRLGDDEDSAGSGEYVFESAHTFNALIQLCLQEMHGILRRHVAGGAAKLEAMPKTRSGVERPDGCAHWKKHQAVARSYLLHAILFLRKLSEPAMTLALLQHLQKLLPFALTFPALCPKLLKELLRAWSAGPHECTLVAFAQIRVVRLPQFGDSRRAIRRAIPRRSSDAPPPPPAAARDGAAVPVRRGRAQGAVPRARPRVPLGHP